MSFTHLHVHSYYSLMDGLNSPAELCQAAKDAGQTCNCNYRSWNIIIT
jgi:DNA polymerase III alpha subunit